MGGVVDRRYVVALLAVYAVGLVVLVTSPWGWGLNRLTVRLYVLFRYDWPIAPLWVLPEDYGVLLNVVLFVPLGVLLPLATGRAWWWVVLVALAASSAVELVQWRWLEREGSWGDVAANTLGALVGAVVVTLLRRPRRSPRAGRRAPPRRS